MGSMSLELKRALGIDAGQEASSIAGRVTGTPPRDALMSEHSDSDSSASDKLGSFDPKLSMGHCSLAAHSFRIQLLLLVGYGGLTRVRCSLPAGPHVTSL